MNAKTFKLTTMRKLLFRPASVALCKWLIISTVLIVGVTIKPTSAQQVVASGGSYYESSDVSISWTIGETIIKTFSAGSNFLTQGFHQPVITVVSVEEIEPVEYNITAFPNPALSHVVLSIIADCFENLSYQLYCFNGSLIKHNTIHDKFTTVSLDNLKPAVYFISIIDKNNKLSTIKLIKN